MLFKHKDANIVSAASKCSPAQVQLPSQQAHHLLLLLQLQQLQGQLLQHRAEKSSHIISNFLNINLPGQSKLI